MFTRSEIEREHVVYLVYTKLGYHDKLNERWNRLGFNIKYFQLTLF